jgi:hypothetical protein
MLDIYADQRVDGVANIGGRASDDTASGVYDFVDLHRDDRHEDVALVVVIILDRADGDFGLRRDRFDLGTLISGFTE